MRTLEEAMDLFESGGNGTDADDMMGAFRRAHSALEELAKYTKLTAADRSGDLEDFFLSWHEDNSEDDDEVDPEKEAKESAKEVEKKLKPFVAKVKKMGDDLAKMYIRDLRQTDFAEYWDNQ